MAINCAAWIFYAKLLGDYYIYFGNLPGVTLGSFYVLTCYKFSKEAVSGPDAAHVLWQRQRPPFPHVMPSCLCVLGTQQQNRVLSSY